MNKSLGLLSFRGLDAFLFSMRGQSRGLRAVYERGLAKDLYHRRMLLGADPVISRSALPNWHYPSEISALKNRLDLPHLDSDLLVQSLTNASFFERSDISEGAKLAQPSNESEGFDASEYESNASMVSNGMQKLESLTLAFLRCHWPLAPEEFICMVASLLLSDESLQRLANSLSLNHLVRTGEFPPTKETLSDAIYALVDILDAREAQHFVVRFVMPYLVELDLEDVMPFRNPLPILVNYLNSRKVKFLGTGQKDGFKSQGQLLVEPRLLYSNGASTAMPCYVVGIYVDQKLIGESPGEKVCIAMDLAAQDALLKLWKVSNRNRVFPFKDIDSISSVFQHRANKQNHSIKDICEDSTDLHLLTEEQLRFEPMDVEEEAYRYVKDIKPVVGLPHRKLLNHKFSRGSKTANTQRKLVKPLVRNI
uniref:Large ribosomal subunit protein mL44 n=1 Tax=Ditylenchus dipsaci TaxID=166011 RepID=A0A915E534_9BILA